MYENKHLVVSNYSVKSEKFAEGLDGFKIVQISDLHNARFGKENKRLLDLIDNQNPDIMPPATPLELLITVGHFLRNASVAMGRMNTGELLGKFHQTADISRVKTFSTISRRCSRGKSCLRECFMIMCKTV